MKTIQHNNKTIHFVPTAHVSKQSILDVQEALAMDDVEAVLIELDRKRAKGLMAESKPVDTDIKTLIKNKEFTSFAAKLLLSSFQKKIADDLETEVGAEMKEAIIQADDLKIAKYYIDRDIDITMNRLWRGLSFYKKASFIVSLLFSSFADDDDLDIEQLKEQDILFQAIKELDTQVPHLSKVILHERNDYMAKKINQNPHNNIVVVIGAAHLDGIIQALDKDIRLNDLRSVPPKKKFNPVQWIFPVLLVVLFTSIFIKNPVVGKQELIRWLLLSSGLSSLGALLVGAHPLTILATFIGAPIGKLSPFINVGFFAGFAEAYVRPPRISDFETLSEDSSHLKMWFKNKFLRTVLIMAITVILSSLGTFISGGSIISKLF